MDFKKIKEKTKNFVEKLRSLEDKQKKIILWTIVGILGLTMGFFWIKGVMYKLENLKAIDFDFPQMETSIGSENLPVVENNVEANNQNIENENLINNSTSGSESEDLKKQIESLEQRLNQLEADNSDINNQK